MSVASLLARGRAAAESLMQDTCIIRRVTGTTTDPNTGVITPTYATVYSGKARIQQRSQASATPADAGQAYVLMLRLEVQLPMSVTGLAVGDEVTIDTSAHDPDLVGLSVLVTDTFSRTVSNGWGNADTGQPWTAEGGTPADFSVASGVGRHSVSAVLSSRRTLIGSGLTDTSQVVSASVPELTSGTGSQQSMVIARYVDNDNCYLFTVFFQPDQSVAVSVQRRLAGAQTALSATVTVPGLTHQAGVPVRIRAEAVGSTLRMRVWQAGQPEPAAWHTTATDTALMAGQCGLRSILAAGNTNTLPVVFSYDDYELTRPRVFLIRDLAHKSHATARRVQITERTS